MDRTTRVVLKHFLTQSRQDARHSAAKPQPTARGTPGRSGLVFPTALKESKSCLLLVPATGKTENSSR
jgi:hypothetical protein